MLRFALALALEIFLLAISWAWLGSFRLRAPNSEPQLQAIIHWQPYHPSLSRGVQATLLPKPLNIDAPLPFVPTPPSDALFLLAGNLRLGKIDVPILKVPRITGAGSTDGGFWIDVPIPGASGLPATSFQVVQTHFDCSTVTNGRSGSVWVAGRVNTSGRVMSAVIMRSHVGRTETLKTLKLVQKWRFVPLRVRGQPTWFRIVLVAWWSGRNSFPEVPLRHPLYSSTHRTRCRSMKYFPHSAFNGVMPHWVLYLLKKHHPLAVLLANGPDPDPEIAQAVALALLRLGSRLHLQGR
jgi:TonB family protein